MYQKNRFTIIFKLFLSILLIVSEITAFSPPVCGPYILRFCKQQRDIPQKIPETKEELRELCNAATEHFKCLLNQMHGCVVNFISFQYSEKNYENNLFGIMEACNESSPHYADIADNLKCFKEFYEEDHYKKCRSKLDLIPDAPKIISKNLIEDGLIPANKDTKYFYMNVCLNTYLWIACYATKLEEQCGTNAMEVYVKFISKINFLQPREVLSDCDETDHLIPETVRLYKSLRIEEIPVLETTTRHYCQDKDIFVVCRSENSIPRDFPETQEELQKICHAAINEYECYLKQLKECKVYIDMEYYNTMIKSGEKTFIGIVEVCNESSSLYSDILDNLKCVKEFHKEDHYEKCQSEMDLFPDAPKIISKNLIKDGLLPANKDPEIFYPMRFCFINYLRIACHATELEGQCGTVAMETYATVISKIMYILPTFYLRFFFDCIETDHLIPDIVHYYRSIKIGNNEIETTTTKSCGYDNRFTYCGLENNMPLKIPETQEELRKICRAFPVKKQK